MDPRINLGFARKAEREVHIHYELANTAHKPIFAFNLMHDYWGLRYPKLPPFPTDDIAQLSHRGNGVVVARMGRIAIPPGISVYVPRLPRATRLESGDTLGAILHIPMPLVEWDAYHAPYSVDDGNAETVPVDRLRLEVEFVFEDECFDVSLENEPLQIYHVLGRPYRQVGDELDAADMGLSIGINPDMPHVASDTSEKKCAGE